MSCFARVSGVMVICSEITDCGKSEQNPASYYYLLVVKLVVKGKRLLLKIFIYKKGARLGHALSKQSAEKLRIPQTHYIICIFLQK